MGAFTRKGAVDEKKSHGQIRRAGSHPVKPDGFHPPGSEVTPLLRTPATCRPRRVMKTNLLWRASAQARKERRGKPLEPGSRGVSACAILAHLIALEHDQENADSWHEENDGRGPESVRAHWDANRPVRKQGAPEEIDRSAKRLGNRRRLLRVMNTNHSRDDP